ncbi:probable serine/threonine-protein kinase PBL18 [Nicotiana sylvestris]|uniref:probable serine/threonine-protein kinase PBL18 n=1 Tax=Nicotiana sylvestris TaxID=4096 RepID=UPI00388CAD09
MSYSEVEILTDENRHPCLMKLKGFCFQYKFAVVYDEKPDNYLSDVLRSGKDFGWDDRMKVATQLASLFTWLHERQFAFNLVLRYYLQDFNIKVLDFGFLVRVKEEDNRVLTIPYLNLPDAPEAYEGTRTLKSDVYVFGVGLVANNKNVYTAYYCWIVDELQRGKR